jgi:hypothetical protein
MVLNLTGVTVRVNYPERSFFSLLASSLHIFYNQQRAFFKSWQDEKVAAEFLIDRKIQSMLTFPCGVLKYLDHSMSEFVLHTGSYSMN